MINQKYDADLSFATLRRVLRDHGLSRRNFEESPLAAIISAIDEKLDGSGCNLGYRAMMTRLQNKYKLKLTQKTVMELMRVLDPGGVAQRRKNRLKRRNYRAHGPMFIIHADGHDKLNRYGFCIHGAIDGFSRKILWLEVSSTNKNPKIIAHYYLKTLSKYGSMPTLLRTDKGTENVIIGSLQQCLRTGHDDTLSGLKSYLKGKSMQNQRIESFWVDLQRLSTGFYMEFSASMIEKGALDLDNPLHKDLLQLCFGPLIRYDLYNIKKEWNQHTIRRQVGRGFRGGKPDILFKLPQQHNAIDCKKPVSEVDISILHAKWAREPALYDQELLELVKIVKPNFSFPSYAREAFELFEELRDNLLVQFNEQNIIYRSVIN